MNKPYGADAMKPKVGGHEKQQKKILYWLNRCRRYRIEVMLSLIGLALSLVAVWTFCTAPLFAQEADTQKKSIVIGVATDFPPYSFLNENGLPTGYEVDLTLAIARVMHLDIEIRIGPFGEIRKLLENGKIDAVPMFYSVERDKLMDFSPPFTIVHNAIFMRGDTPAIETEDDLYGRDIILISGDIMHDYVLENGLSDNLMLVPTESDAMRLLASGKHDCALMAQLPGLYWAKKLGLSNIVTVGPLLRPSEICYAVREDNTALLHKLSEGLVALATTGELKDIRNEWLGVLDPRGTPVMTIFKYVAIVVVPLLLLLALVVIWSRILKRQVTQRTSELRESESKFGILVTSTEEIVYIIDKDGTFILSEGKGLSELGLKPEQVVGKSVFEIFKDYPDMLNSIRDALKGETVTTEAKVGDIYFRNWCTPHKNLEGETIGLFGLSVNITEQKKAENDLKIERDNLKNIFKAMIDGIYIVDRQYNIQYVNSVLERDFGSPEGIKCHKYFHDSDEPCSFCKNDDVFAGKTVHWEWTSPKNGKTYDLIDTPLKNIDGSISKLEISRDITERKLAEEKLRESEKKFRFATVAGQIAVWRVELPAGKVIAGGALERLLGYQPGEIDDWKKINHPEDRDRLEQLWKNIFQKKTDRYDVEQRLLCKDGNFRWFLARGQVVWDNDTKGTIIGMTQDITERKKAERTQEVLLDISENSHRASSLYQLSDYIRKHLSNVMDTTNFYIALYDAERGLYTFPFSTEKFDGSVVTHEQMKKSLTDYVRRNKRPLLVDEKLLNQLIKEGECELVGKASKIWMGAPLIIDNNVIGVIALQSYTDACAYTKTDLDTLVIASNYIANSIQRKRSELELLKISFAIEQSANTVVITDTDGNIEYVNPKFTEVTGYTADEVIGQNPRILQSGEMSDESYEELWKTIASGKSWSGEFRNKKKSGELFWEKATISPITDRSGSIISYLAIKEDITEQKKSEKGRRELEMEMNQARKLEAVGSLAAGIAHEINTPIQFVGDNTNFLSDSFKSLLSLVETYANLWQKARAGVNIAELDTERVTAKEEADFDYLKEEVPLAIEQTLEGVQRVTKIVRAMKDFAHSDQGEKSVSDINDMLLTCLTVSRNELKYVADVETDLCQELPELECYRDDLNQVFLNLLVNAAHTIKDVVGDASAGKGIITVSTERDNDSVIIKISDTGKGIPQSIQDRVFDPFFSTKDVGKGSGQGLAIARKIIVDKHQGSLNFETEEGKGTTFIIRLPVKIHEKIEEVTSINC